jgi:hypothetical protein
MDKESQIKLEEILKKDPSSITEADKIYLLARRSYVGRNSRKKFSAIFARKK